MAIALAACRSRGGSAPGVEGAGASSRIAMGASSEYYPAGKLGATGASGATPAGDGAPAVVDAGSALAPALLPSPAAAYFPMPNARSARLPNPASLDASAPGIVTDKVTGLVWQRTPDRAGVPWAKAAAVCTRLRLAGAADWRMPSRLELISIVDATRSAPAIDTRAFPATPSQWFWTGSVESGNTTGAAWVVSFESGAVKPEPTNGVFPVRCVRTYDLPKTRAIKAAIAYDAYAETVRDRGTNLLWQRALTADSFTFDGAAQYCARLNLGGATGWRVPSFGELQTLIDENEVNPAIVGRAFPSTPNEAFWTSTLAAGRATLAWTVYFGFGNSNPAPLLGKNRVRCVRDPHQ